MIVIDGDHIMINTHLKSYELAPAEVKRVVRRSKNYVYFEKQDGEKIELEIRDFSEETLDRFIRVFQVVDEDKLTDWLINLILPLFLALIGREASL